MLRDVLRYLGYPANVEPDDEVKNLVEKALQEVESCAQFRYLYSEYHDFFDFMHHEGYRNYLTGADSFLLCATTLGTAVDRQLRRWQVRDMRYALIFDAAASVYLEHQADDFEKQLPFKHLGFRFCPGYGETPLDDNRFIADQLKAHTIGISFLNSGLMVPMKSMVGLIRIGGETEKNCDNCVALSRCAFHKRGERCYR